MPNVINEMLVRELDQSMDEADGLIVATLFGLTVAETEGLRDSLAEQGVKLRMVRKKLADRVMRERGIEFPDGVLSGSTALAWGSPEDAIHAAKVLNEPKLKKEGKVDIRGALFEGNLLDAAEAMSLASLPTKDEIRSMLLSCVSGPARGLVGVLAAPGGALARVIQARVDAGGGPEPEAEG